MIPFKAYIAAGGVSLVLALSAFIYWQINRNADLRNERDGLQTTITNTENFNEGTANPDNVPWFERLFPSTAN